MVLPVRDKTGVYQHQNNRILIGDKEWGNTDLNCGPTDYESAALTTELLPRNVEMMGLFLTRKSAFKQEIWWVCF